MKKDGFTLFQRKEGIRAKKDVADRKRKGALNTGGGTAPAAEKSWSRKKKRKTQRRGSSHRKKMMKENPTTNTFLRKEKKKRRRLSMTFSSRALLFLLRKGPLKVQGTGKKQRSREKEGPVPGSNLFGKKKKKGGTERFVGPGGTGN